MAAPLPDSVAAWDLPTRLFKWTLVALVFAAWATHRWGDVTLRWHKAVGYSILVLVVFRLLWGVFGPSTARFRHWVYGPLKVARHGWGLLRGRHEAWLGHTPLGGWMIAALLALLGAQGFAGLFSADSNNLFGGPFGATDPMESASLWQARLSWFHHHAFNLLLALIAIHVAVVLVHQFLFKDGLITAMVTGSKPAAQFLDAQAMTTAPMLWLRASLCLAAAAAVVLGGVKLAGGALL